MTPYRLYQVDAFTRERFKGNPAGVVPRADGLTEPEMQAIARELNNSETAFLLSPSSPDHDVHVRFFTPTMEVPSCGHATIAAHYVRAREMDLPSCTVVQRTGIGTLPVEIVREPGDYKIVMTQGAIQFATPLPRTQSDEILRALGLTPEEADPRCPMQIVSTGHPKVMIGLRHKQVLDSLRPDLADLRELSRRIDCSGYFAFSLNDGSSAILAHGRMFAPAIGIPEDPVTGNANGPLGAYLVHHRLVAVSGGTFTFSAMQGEAMGRPGIVEVTVDLQGSQPKTVRVGGRAVVAFKAELELGSAGGGP